MPAVVAAYGRAVVAAVWRAVEHTYLFALVITFDHSYERAIFYWYGSTHVDAY